MIVRWGYRRVPLSVRAVSHHSRYLGEERTVVLDLPWLSACPKTATAERMRSYKSLPSFTSGMSDCCQNFDVNWLFKTLLLRRQTCPVCLLNFSFWTFYLLSADWPQLQAWILSCSQQTGPAPPHSRPVLRTEIFRPAGGNLPPPVSGGSAGAKCQSSICSAGDQIIKLKITWQTQNF